MANQIVGQMYYIDSAMGSGTPILGATSASWPHEMRITNVGLWSSDTTGLFELVFAHNTGVCAFKLSNPNHASAYEEIHLGEPLFFSELRVKTLTAGTGFIYFS